MAKAKKVDKKAKAIVSGMPKAPLVYVSDPTPCGIYGRDLSALIPDAVYVCVQETFKLPDVKSTMVLVDKKGDKDIDKKIKRARTLQEAAISQGINFVSVNIVEDKSRLSETSGFGTNHLNIEASPDTATKVYQWLFSVLTIRETLYLIPKEQLVKPDTKTFPDYAYCPISETQLHSKDAKIQFVGLILDKPQIQEGKKLAWRVADHTGMANFYFQYRDGDSQYTWDWVLGLKPGDRRALPRMPMVEIKEKKRVRVIKAPFRATGFVVAGTGLAIKAIGTGLCKAGKMVFMGNGSEWVAQADIGPDGKKIDWSKRPSKDNLAKERKLQQSQKKMINIFNEKGEKTWSDGASVASTDVGSVYDEKTEKDFV